MADLQSIIAPQDNPFDQFDAQPVAQANPFDQFDAPKSDSAVGSMVRGAVDAGTFNLAEPIVSALQATFGDAHQTSQAPDWLTRYHENLAANKGGVAADRADHPVASLVGDVAGGFANPANRLLAPITDIKSAARVGGQLGLGYGVGSGVTDDKSVGDTVDQGINGAVGGALTGSVLQGIGGAVAQRLLKRPATDIPAIKRAADAAYAASDNTGTWISQPSMAAMSAKLTPTLLSEGMAPGLHDNAITAAGLVDKASQGNITWKGLDILRKQVGAAIGNAVRTSPDDARITHLIQDHLDNYVNGLGASDIVPGTGSAADLQNGIQSLQTARSLWRAKSQAEFVSNLMDAADLRSNGLTMQAQQNAIRGRFMTAALNKNQMRRLDPDLQTAIRTVAQGTPTISALRLLGKFQPTGLHSITMGGGVGYALGGPVGAAALMGAGEAGAVGAQALTRKAANTALAIAGRVPAGVKLQPGLRSLPRYQIAAAKAALQLPRVTAGVLPVLAGGSQ